MKDIFRDRQSVWVTSLFFSTLAIISVGYLFLRPSIHPVAIMQGGTMTQISLWSEASIPTPKDEAQIVFHVQTPLPLGKVQFYVDDCLLAVTVNSQAVQDARFPYCNWNDFLTLDVGDAMHIGSNTVIATVRNDAGTGGLTVTIARASWLYRLALGLFLSAIVAYACYVVRRAQPFSLKILIAMLALGTFLRVFYVAYTDFDTRAYDWQGHLEYIRFMADHWTLPKGNAGWEFHQQPLYYLFGGAVLSVMRVFHAQDAFVRIMQLCSLLMSLGTLFACGWIATMLFPAKQKHVAVQRFVFLGVIATLPGVVMLASRVNNDVPMFLFAALCIAFLLSWWKHGKQESWILTVVFLSLALLTKSSALPLIAPVGLAWLLRREALRVKLWNALPLIGIPLVLVGWVVVLRIVVYGQQELIPVWVGQGLRVINFPGAYLTFNPLQILWHPFNHNWIDADRRQFLWEYLLKSAFFGEWNFASYFRIGAILLLSTAMLLLPVALWGIVRSLLKRASLDFILASLLLFSLAALAFFRYSYPNSSNQELRYVIFLLLPLGYFLARGISTPRWLCVAGTFLTSILFVGSSWFLILAALHSY